MTLDLDGTDTYAFTSEVWSCSSKMDWLDSSSSFSFRLWDNENIFYVYSTDKWRIG